MSDRQLKAYDTLMADGVTELLYGGAKGGGKSVLGCYWAMLKALALIQEFSLSARRYPIPVAWMGRARAVDFLDTTLETWKRFIPSDLYQLRSGDREIVIGDAVKIDYGGLDSEDQIRKFNSAEYAYIFVDQAEETTRDTVATLRATRRLRINDRRPAGGYKALFTANPAKCWLKDEFITKPAADQRFVRALPRDNPWLDERYIDELRRAFGHRPELLAAYLDGSWDEFEGSDQLIRESWVLAARGRKFFPEITFKVVVCDVARYGDNETVIYDLEDTQIKRAEIFGQKDTMYTANKVFLHVREHGKGGPCLVVIDTCGVGGGVADRLVEMGVDVLQLNGSEKAGDSVQFYNLRAEVWWTAGQMFAEGDVACEWEDEGLVRDLCTPTYFFKNGRVLVQDKDEIKKDLGRSPDRGDAYVMGLYGLNWLKGGRVKMSDGVTRRKPVPMGGQEPPYGSYAARQRDYERARRRRQTEWVTVR